jgi:hypothetical protein
VVYHPPVIKALPPGLPHARPLEPLQSPAAVNLQGDDYRRAAAQYSDDPHYLQTSAGGPQMARPLHETGQSYTSTRSDLPETPGQGRQFGHGHVMFSAPESPYTPAHARTASYGYGSALSPAPAAVVSPPLEDNQHGYEYDQARAAAAAERERQQAEADAQRDDVYAADATILPATHIYPVHAIPEVQQLEERPKAVSSPMTTPATATGSPLYSREQPPPYNLVERGSTRTLTVGDWTIRTVKRPILNGKEIDAYVRSLNVGDRT